MPFVIRAGETREGRRAILAAGDTADGRILIDHVAVAGGTAAPIETPAGSIAWVEMLTGAGRIGEAVLGAETIAVLPADFSGRFEAEMDATFLLSIVPDAERFHAAPAPEMVKTVDWSREPVLKSEHDERRRIYVLTESLFGIGAVKGEIIRYPDGATCPEHHHEGAEHYQYVRSGRGTVVVEGQEIELAAGDLLYNFENEHHWFYNRSGADFVFTEYFVPGHCKTVWVPQAEVCAWLPTGADTAGRKPVREIGYHVHGDATPV